MDWDYGWDFGPRDILGGLARAIMAIASLFGGLILLLGAILVAVLLVRFLLVATKAAQLYVDRHSPEDRRPSASGDGPAPDGPSSSTSAATSTPAATTTPAQDTTPPDTRAGEPRPGGAPAPAVTPPSDDPATTATSAPDEDLPGVVSTAPAPSEAVASDPVVSDAADASTPTAAYPTTPLADRAAPTKPVRAPRSRTTKKPPTAGS